MPAFNEVLDLKLEELGSSVFAEEMKPFDAVLSTYSRHAKRGCSK